MRIDRIGAPMREQAVRHLRSAIVAGRFQPGQRLLEREICELLGASRTVVREALRHLESEGLVQTVAGHGPTVPVLTEKTARDIYEARAAIEGMAAELCAVRATDEALEELDVAHAVLDEAYSAGDTDVILAAKERFYETLFKAADNDVLYTFVRTLHARVTQLRAASLSPPGRQRRSRAEIQALMVAIRRRDGDTARALAEEHVQNAAAVGLTVFMERSHADDVSSQH